MKILYAIQGTGNGHISRARDIIPHLQDFCQCDILVSGTQSDVRLGYPVKYRFKGLSFVFGRSGGVDIWKTLIRADFFRLFREISQVPVEDYDLIINDFEPVSAWACKRKNVQCISLSHQGALKSRKVPLPERSDFLGKWILENYAPSAMNFGFHFKPYDEHIYTPVIRQQVRESLVEELDHYTVYLPSYDDKHLVQLLSRFESTQWHVFSKHSKKSYRTGNIVIKPIENNSFVEDMAKSQGVLCGAGFETPAEALFLKKKVMVIPMHGQYEQQCNAAALKEMGIPVIYDLNTKNTNIIKAWIESGKKIEVNYPDLTRLIVRKILELKVQNVIRTNSWELSYQLTNQMAKV